VSIDGGAKTGKSTVGDAIARAITQYRKVKVADAGAFYRRVTVGVFGEFGNDISSLADDLALDHAIQVTLRKGTAFDDSYPWGDLERPEVGDWVSIVGRRSSVQQEAMRWYEQIVMQAAESVDVLVINARNPVSHLKKWLDNRTLHLSLELYTDCDPKVAAYRKLTGHGVSNPSAKQIKLETEAIIARRKGDLTRPTDTFVLPTTWVSFNLGDDPAKTVEQWRAINFAGGYSPIRFDTSDMPKLDMEQAVEGLVLAALDLP